MKNLQDFTVRLIAGGNIATIVCMLLIGFSDRINPVSHPLLANIGLFFPVFLAINVGFLFFWLIVRKRMAIFPSSDSSWASCRSAPTRRSTCPRKRRKAVLR